MRQIAPMMILVWNVTTPDSILLACIDRDDDTENDYFSRVERVKESSGCTTESRVIVVRVYTVTRPD
jgi:hypothetical protein